MRTSNNNFADWECNKRSLLYAKQLGVSLSPYPVKIQFNNNYGYRWPVHRWAPYIQGFSGSFVADVLGSNRRPTFHVHDPFAGCGTVLVESKLSGKATSSGTEMNPFLSYVTNTKLNSWKVAPRRLVDSLRNLRSGKPAPYPTVVQTERHFNPAVLYNLQRILGHINRKKKGALKDLLRVALASCLIECSKLKRTPCLGYSSIKKVRPSTAFDLFEERVQQMAKDLRQIQAYSNSWPVSKIVTADARSFSPPPTDLVITSPPYVNGIDYIINYKIEMAWLGFFKDSHYAKQLKDEMVACDNISKGVTKQFASERQVYTNDWLTNIVSQLQENIASWGPTQKRARIQRNRKVGSSPSQGYRRPDMPLIVHKYFDDIHKVLLALTPKVKRNGQMVFVVGDSFIANVYIPTDLIIARMAQELGFQIDSITIARKRHSGQIRSFALRETVTTMTKVKDFSSKFRKYEPKKDKQLQLAFTAP